VTGVCAQRAHEADNDVAAADVAISTRPGGQAAVIAGVIKELKHE
jgi:hypothetical protein